MNLNFRNLSFALLNSWGADTASGDWREDIPSLNQCAVTALVVQDFFGGSLLRSALDGGGSHYWNSTLYLGEVDLTFQQFALIKQNLVGETIVRDREYVLSFPDTKNRYEILKNRISKFMEEN